MDEGRVACSAPFPLDVAGLTPTEWEAHAPRHDNFRSGWMQIHGQATEARTQTLSLVDAKLSDVVPRQLKQIIPSALRVSTLPSSRKWTTSAARRTGDNTDPKTLYLNSSYLLAACL